MVCNNFIVKLGFSIITCVVAVTLLHHRSSAFPPFSNSPLFQNTRYNPASSVNYADQLIPKDDYGPELVKNAESCDLLVGDWVPFEEEPFYNKSCSFIVDPQNCMKNGRPDTDFVHWRWKPRACDLSRFDPLKFLETMRNKNWAFIGDSLSRNHFESLMCMLSRVEEATLLYREGNQTQKWFLPSYNITASLIWSPFLAKAIIPKDIYDTSPSEVHLHLDTLDPAWTDHYKTWDYAIFSTALWYSKRAIFYENNTILGCHSCANFTELGFEPAYRRVMKGVLDYIVESNHTGSTIYRTTTPDHFESGEWFNGGVCERTGPAKAGEFELSWLVRTFRNIEMEEFGKAYLRASQNGVKLRLLDVNEMSLLRPDGHPGIYTSNESKEVKKVYSDCLHWCLPGPIDSWTDVLMEMIVNG